jgi:hypothetical protein
VIVVGAERHVCVPQLRIGAGDDADDVAGEAGADHRVIGVDVQGELDAFEVEHG